MTYETRLLRFAAESGGLSANWICCQEINMCSCVFLLRQILESFRLTQGSGLRAGLLVGLPRAGQLIVEFWPSRWSFWAVWRFPQSSGATVRACQAQAFVLMLM